MSVLRVIDAGDVEPFRSQALWHGIADAMRDDSAPTLSFCRPTAPYVGLGLHRRLDEVDVERCRALDLPLIRRQIGGGPVYLDRDQLFFQITLPARVAPARIDLLYREYLAPAVAALRALGLDAHRNGLNDLAVAKRKISGTGAGRIGDGVTVVGNVLFRFPHRRMAEILALPTETMRAEYLRLMRLFVTSLAAEGLATITADDVRKALVDAYAAAFGPEIREQAPSAEEEAAIERFVARFHDPEWLAGEGLPARGVRQVKVSADAWVFAAGHDPPCLEASIVEGRIDSLRLDQRQCATAGAMQETLIGQPADSAALRRCLEPFSYDGMRLLTMLEPGLDGPEPTGAPRS